MQESSPYTLVLCTCPDDETAEEVASALVAERLAACVNIVGNLRSVYRWEGTVESAEERLLVIKTRADLYPEVQAAVLARHPYELPEIVCVRIDAGLDGYLSWLGDSVRDPS